MSHQRVPGPTQTAVDGASGEWEAKPIVAGATRATIVLFPYVVGFAVALAFSMWLPPDRFSVHPLVWWAAVAVVSTAAMVPADRFIRRLMPLSSLLTVAIAFPDGAPSRFRSAMRATTTAQTRRRVAEAVADSARGRDVDRSLYMLDLLALLTSHDRLTRGHSERVRAYSTLIGDELRLSKTDQQKLYWAALLHDIGKVDVPSAILNKAGRPTNDEWNVLQTHPAAGTKYLAPLRGWLGGWVGAADEHHLRWDGKGYPRSLGGTDISIAGRIVAVADAYDVMTSARSYKEGMSPADARVELSTCAGGQFDPTMVRAFLNVGLAKMRLATSPLPMLPVMLGTLLNGAATTAGKALLATTAMSAGVAASPSVEAPLVPDVLAYVQDAQGWFSSSDDSPVTVTIPAQPGETRPAPTAGPTATPQPSPTPSPTATATPSERLNDALSVPEAGPIPRTPAVTPIPTSIPRGVVPGPAPTPSPTEVAPMTPAPTPVWERPPAGEPITTQPSESRRVEPGASGGSSPGTGTTGNNSGNNSGGNNGNGNNSGGGGWAGGGWDDDDGWGDDDDDDDDDD